MYKRVIDMNINKLSVLMTATRELNKRIETYGLYGQRGTKLFMCAECLHNIVLRELGIMDYVATV